MKEQDIRTYTVKIYSSLEQKRLKESFDLLTLILSELQNWQLNDKKDELETTYKFMLRYLTEGVKDPEQQHIYEDLLRSCYKLADYACYQLNLKYSSRYYFDWKRSQLHAHDNESLQSVFATQEEVSGKITLTNLLEEAARNAHLYDLQKENEALSSKIFHFIWLNEQLNDEDYKVIDDFMSNKTNSSIVKCLIVSAITLSLQEAFDENKVLQLLQLCEDTNEEVRQRALIGLLLFLRKYDKRLWLYSKINNRLSHLSENKLFASNVRDIILQFILSRETEKITRKIQEEIIPEMMKISPELRNKIKLDDLIGESGMEDKNPEWTEILEKSGLTDKLQEFSELQMEGADIMHSSFAHLKSYAFFNELSNWFLPFHTDQTIFNEDRTGEIREMVETLNESSVLCNSDKYSFFLSIAQMPETYRKMMIGQFSAESQAVKEMQKEELPGSLKKLAIVSKQYIQDLYRFYKIHPQKGCLEDIFEEKPDFYQVDSIDRIVSDKESRVIIGEYYFTRNYYNEALSVFDQLIREGGNDEVLFQKKGYCLQMLGNLEDALQQYLTAELLNGNSSWTIKKIAYCYRMLKKPEEALAYYLKVEQFNPDNLSIQLSIGHCHLELKDYTEALKCYFKVEYLDRNGERAWRPIAWCSFLTGKYEQAMDYFEKIIETKPDASDYLNIGHTQLAMGRINDAIRYYKQSIVFFGNSVAKFEESFKNDLPELILAGVEMGNIPLVLDRLMYDVSLR